MSNFTPLVTQEFEFEGDKIIVVFSRLKRKHMLAAMPAFKRITDAEDNEEIKQEAISDVLNIVVDFLPEYVTSFEGLNDAEGNPVTIQMVCEEFYFMHLVAQIAMSMLSTSSGKEGKV